MAKRLTKHPNTKGEAASFVEGLRQIRAKFEQEASSTTDTYEAYVKEAGAEFQETSHTYAQDMWKIMDDAMAEIKDMYFELYPDEGEGGEGEETPPPEPEVEPPTEQVPPPATGAPAKAGVPPSTGIPVTKQQGGATVPANAPPSSTPVTPAKTNTPSNTPK